MEEKPDFCTEAHLEFLDDLRERSAVMSESVPFLHEEFPDLVMVEARAILGYWLDSFSERHKS